MRSSPQPTWTGIHPTFDRMATSQLLRSSKAECRPTSGCGCRPPALIAVPDRAAGGRRLTVDSRRPPNRYSGATRGGRT
jgi:hypothetical protein